MINNKELIKDLKKRRMKPEERWFIDILLDLKEYTSDKYSNLIFYKKDNEILFKYNLKNRFFYCNYDKTWSIFESKYHLSYKQIIELIKGKVDEHLKLRDVIPLLFR